MSRSYDIEVEADAPVETVWALVEDGTRWSEWTRLKRSTYEREGDPPPHGVGAVRAFSTPLTHTRERVLAHEPPRHFAYALDRGLPLRGYRADVRLEPRDGGGTRIHWTGTWDGTPPLLGAALRWFVTTAVRDIARSLVKEAERRASP